MLQWWDTVDPILDFFHLAFCLTSEGLDLYVDAFYWIELKSCSLPGLSKFHSQQTFMVKVRLILLFVYWYRKILLSFLSKIKPKSKFSWKTFNSTDFFYISFFRHIYSSVWFGFSFFKWEPVPLAHRIICLHSIWSQKSRHYEVKG